VIVGEGDVGDTRDLGDEGVLIPLCPLGLLRPLGLLCEKFLYAGETPALHKPCISPWEYGIVIFYVSSH